MQPQTNQSQLVGLAQVFRDLPVGFCVFNLDLQFVFVNELLAAMNGVPAADHIGRTMHQVAPHIAAGVEAQLRQVIDTGEPIIGGEVQAETPANPGVMHVFQHTYTAIKDTEDAIIGVSCLVQDHSEQRRAVDAMHEGDLRLQLVIDALPVAINYIDVNERYLLINKTNAAWFGRSATDIIGRTPVEVFGPNFYERFRPQVLNALQGHDFTLETTVSYPDGVTRNILITRKPDINPGGECLGMFSLVQDITASNQTQKRIRHTQRMEAVGQLTGGIAHDFNNILGIALGNLQLLKRRLNDDPESLELAEAALKGVRRGADITEKLLGFSGRERNEAKATAINELCLSV